MLIFKSMKRKTQITIENIRKGVRKADYSPSFSRPHSAGQTIRGLHIRPGLPFRGVDLDLIYKYVTFPSSWTWARN